MDVPWLTLGLAAVAAAVLAAEAWWGGRAGGGGDAPPSGVRLPDDPAAVGGEARGGGGERGVSAAGGGGGEYVFAPTGGPSAGVPVVGRVAGRVRAWAAAARRRPGDVAVAVSAAAAGLYVWAFAPRPGAGIRPGELGSPFNGLRFIFELGERHTAAWPGLVGGAALACGVGLALGAWGSRRADRPDEARRRGDAAVLVCALGLIGLGQLALFDLYLLPPLVDFGLGIALAAVWARRYRGRWDGDLAAGAWPRLAEWLAVGGVLGATAFLRLYGLHVLPYGIEGDESKWVVEVIASMRYGQYPEGADFHLYTMPGSFFMQAPFHRWLGPGLYAARFTVALYSVVGSAVFYVLARRLANAPVAWLATLLLAVSPLDISASRLANVESHVKLMPLVALLCLEWATRSGRTRAYGLAGVATALALLTYDTVLPLAGVAVVAIGAAFVAQRRRPAWCAPRVAAFALPIALATPVLIAYFAGRFSYYGVARPGEAEPLAGRLAANAAELAHGIFVATPGDFLYNRFGPMFNALLLPWLVLGTIAALAAWRRRGAGWWLLFGGLFFVPVPVLTGVPGARVMYPAIAAAYALMALGLHAAYRELARAGGPVLRAALVTAGGLGLALVVYSELYIAFNHVHDPDDRRIRRELMETARAAGGPDALVLFPFAPGVGDPIEAERHFAIWMGMLDVADPAGATHAHAVVPLDGLLPALGDAAGRHARIEVVWTALDADASPAQAAALAELARCYPSMSAGPAGQFYRRVVLPGNAAPAAGCGEGGG